MFCITNDIPDLRSCVEIGEHRDGCPGVALRWDIDISISPMYSEGHEARLVSVQRTIRNPLSHTSERVDVPCAGCMPREATHGLLCWSCWEKVDDALSSAVDMIGHLRSVERSQQLDNAGVRSAQLWSIPVPVSWRMADELLMLLGAPAPGIPVDASTEVVAGLARDTVYSVNPDVWVASELGAEDAVRFYLGVQAAKAQHPMAEDEHRVRNVRCYQCKQRTLLWKPPLMFEGDVRVVCTNPKCGAVLDQTLYEHVALVEDPKSPWAKAKAAAEKVGPLELEKAS